MKLKISFMLYCAMLITSRILSSEQDVKNASALQYPTLVPHQEQPQSTQDIRIDINDTQTDLDINATDQTFGIIRQNTSLPHVIVQLILKYTKPAAWDCVYRRLENDMSERVQHIRLFYKNDGRPYLMSLSTGTYFDEQHNCMNLTVWDITARTQERPLKHTQVFLADVSPTGNILVYTPAHTRKTMYCWDLYKNELSTIMNSTHPRTITSLKFSPQGTYCTSTCLDNTIRIWRTDHAPYLQWVTEHTGDYLSLSHNETRMLISDSSGNLSVADCTDMNNTHTMWSQTGIHLTCEPQFSPHGTYVIAAISNTIALLNPQSGQTIYQIKQSRYKHAITNIGMTDDERQLIFAINEHVSGAFESSFHHGAVSDISVVNILQLYLDGGTNLDKDGKIAENEVHYSVVGKYHTTASKIIRTAKPLAFRKNFATNARYMAHIYSDDNSIIVRHPYGTTQQPYGRWNKLGGIVGGLGLIAFGHLSPTVFLGSCWEILRDGPKAHWTKRKHFVARESNPDENLA